MPSGPPAKSSLSSCCNAVQIESAMKVLVGVNEFRGDGRSLGEFGKGFFLFGLRSSIKRDWILMNTAENSRSRIKHFVLEVLKWNRANCKKQFNGKLF